MIPTPWSMTSSSLPRPAPSATAARPTRSASIAATKPGRGAATVVAIGRRRQTRVVVDDARIAALMLDDLAELLDASARGDRLADARLGVGFVDGDARDDEHPRCQQHRQLLEILRDRIPSASRSTR